MQILFLCTFLFFQFTNNRFSLSCGYFGEADPCFGDIDPLAENGSKNR